MVQFNDCGMAMDDQADETWEYRGRDANGSFRLHVEFGDNGVVRRIAKIPDASGGQPTVAKIAPGGPHMSMGGRAPEGRSGRFVRFRHHSVSVKKSRISI